MLHLVFDTETTNLIHNSLQPLSKQPRVIEIFGLILDDEQGMKEVSHYHRMINPGVPITQEITKITGITNEMVKDAPRFKEIAGSFVDLLEAVDVVVAHNLLYDKTIMDFEFKRLDEGLKWPSHKVCTVESTEHFKGHRLNLNALHTELFGEGFSGAHRAEQDVRALARCYVKLVEMGEV
jgi:DNA polymerase-3 subunit epsilon